MYGDCHAHMVDQASEEGVVRVEGMNCCELIAGKEAHRRLVRQGAFCLLPEWAERWRELLARLMDLGDGETAEMMREMHTKFVYLDTGTRSVPEEALEECSRHFLMPYEIAAVPLDGLLARIRDAMDQLDSGADGDG